MIRNNGFPWLFHDAHTCYSRHKDTALLRTHQIICVKKLPVLPPLHQFCICLDVVNVSLFCLDFTFDFDLGCTTSSAYSEPILAASPVRGDAANLIRGKRRKWNDYTLFKDALAEGILLHGGILFTFGVHAAVTDAIAARHAAAYQQLFDLHLQGTYTGNQIYLFHSRELK